MVGDWFKRAASELFCFFFLLQVLSAGVKSGDWVFFFFFSFSFHLLSSLFPRPPPSLSFTAVVMKQPTFPPVTVLSVCYSTCGYWTYERTEGVSRDMWEVFRKKQGRWRYEVLLSSESSGRGASFIGSGWRWSSVSGAVLNASLMLKVVVTVLTNPHWWRDLQPFDLWLEATTPAKQGEGVEIV